MAVEKWGGGFVSGLCGWVYGDAQVGRNEMGFRAKRAPFQPFGGFRAERMPSCGRNQARPGEVGDGAAVGGMGFQG